MSLMEALLLDPAPLDIWVAARSDGVIGSGTEDDPFDGSRAGPASVPIAPITSVSTTATVITGYNHGFSNGDVVFVEGATGPDAPLYNGVFPITYASPTSFTYTLTATPIGPAIGALSCRLDPYPVITITNLVGMNRTTTATATVSSGTHSFKTGDPVLIAGATGADAAFYNGVFFITVLSSTQFTYTMAGIPGSDAVGTITCQADPYMFDSVMRSLPVPILGLTSSGGVATAVANAHRFPDQSSVLISGATGTDAQYYNGVHQITPVPGNPNAFTYAFGGSATAAAGNLSCRLYQFEAAARPFPQTPPYAVRLGPGVFQTRGYTPAAVSSWVPRSGMKFFGSGMGISVLQLVQALIDENKNDYLAIGSDNDNYTDDFEACDFTVDCNIAGQPSSRVACGGISVNGTRVRLRRIRAISFGTQTSPVQTECFVLSIGAVKVLHVVVNSVQVLEGVEGAACLTSDCILEQPGLNNALETTCLTSGGGEVGDFMVYARGSVIRNCFVNCEYRDKPAPVLSVKLVSGNLFKVTTSLPHRHADGDWVIISGALLAGSPYNSFNGSYQITKLDDFSFQYTPTNPAQTSSDGLSGNISVGRFPSHLVQIDNSQNNQITVSGSNPWLVTVTTLTAHFLVPGRTVLMNGVYLNGNKVDLLNGPFTVYSVLSPTKFTFQVSSNPGTGTFSGDTIGANFQGGGVEGGTAAVWEGNRILNLTPALYNDTLTSRDQISRDNYLRGVSFGSRQVLKDTQVSTTPVAYPLSSLMMMSGTVATATTTLPNGFVALNDLVIITGATGTDMNKYNGTFTIQTVPDPKTFTYTPNGTLNVNPSGTPSYATGGNAPDGLPPDKQQRLLGYLPPLGGTFTPALTFAVVNGVYVATATVSSYFPQGHGLAVGETVYISKATPGTPPSPYNGYFVVTAVSLDGTQFQYILPSNPGGSSDSGYFGRLSTGGRIAEENNIMDLAPSQTDADASAGVSFGDGVGLPPALFPQVLLRRNVMRKMDGISDAPNTPPNFASQGVSVGACGTLTVEENIIDLPAVPNIQQRYCGSTKYFANLTSAGALIQGYNLGPPSAYTEELTTNIDDAAVLAF